MCWGGNKYAWGQCDGQSRVRKDIERGTWTGRKLPCSGVEEIQTSAQVDCLPTHYIAITMTVTHPADCYGHYVYKNSPSTVQQKIISKPMLHYSIVLKPIMYRMEQQLCTLPPPHKPRLKNHNMKQNLKKSEEIHQ